MKHVLRHHTVKKVTLGLLLLSFSAQAHVEGKGTTRIDIKMTASEKTTLAQPVRAEIEKAEADIYEDGVLTQHADIDLHSRGQSSLKNFIRKSLEIKPLGTEKKLASGSIKSKEMYLSASPSDLLLTKNMIVYRLYDAFKIPTMKTDYAEVVINNESQGLYMVSKSPAEHLLNEDAEIVFRRRYNDFMELKKADKKLTDDQIQEYKNQMASIYKDLKTLKGKALVKSLKAKMNIDGYLKWLALNYLVRNGDFVDEVFMFGKKDKAGKMYFDIFPWDLDDTFASKMHMQGIPFTSNHWKKKRSDRQMLFGFESRLDQAVSQDGELLNEYFKVLKEVTTKLTDDKLNAIFNEVSQKLAPYLSDADILKNGELDLQKTAHTPEMVAKAFADKKAFIQKNIATVKAELAEIDQEEVGDRASHIYHKGLFLQKLFLKYAP